jgi:hypothetical protein
MAQKRKEFQEKVWKGQKMFPSELGRERAIEGWSLALEESERALDGQSEMDSPTQRKT